MTEGPPDLSGSFFLRFANACGRLGISPMHLIRVCFSESGGVRAKAHNPNGNAVGIFQAMPDTLKRLGWTHGWEAYLQLPAEDQVIWLERYYRPYARYCRSDALCYVATFLPAMLQKAAESGPGFIMCAMGGPLEWAYKANKALDHDKDEAITVADMSTQLAKACVGERYAAIVHRLRSAMGEDPGPLPEPPETQPELPDFSEPKTDPTRMFVIDDVAGLIPLSGEATEEFLDLPRKLSEDDDE